MNNRYRKFFYWPSYTIKIIWPSGLILALLTCLHIPTAFSQELLEYLRSKFGQNEIFIGKNIPLNHFQALVPPQLKITAISPMDGEEDVAITPQIKITFNREVPWDKAVLNIALMDVETRTIYEGTLTKINQRQFEYTPFYPLPYFQKFVLIINHQMSGPTEKNYSAYSLTYFTTGGFFAGTGIHSPQSSQNLSIEPLPYLSTLPVRPGGLAEENPQFILPCGQLGYPLVPQQQKILKIRRLYYSFDHYNGHTYYYPLQYEQVYVTNDGRNCFFTIKADDSGNPHLVGQQTL